MPEAGLKSDIFLIFQFEYFLLRLIAFRICNQIEKWFTFDAGKIPKVIFFQGCKNSIFSWNFKFSKFYQGSIPDDNSMSGRWKNIVSDWICLPETIQTSEKLKNSKIEKVNAFISRKVDRKQYAFAFRCILHVFSFPLLPEFWKSVHRVLRTKENTGQGHQTNWRQWAQTDKQQPDSANSNN